MNRIPHHWIIGNEKNQKISLVHKFLQVTLSIFLIDFLIFYNTSQNTDFSFKKSEILLF